MLGDGRQEHDERVQNADEIEEDERPKPGMSTPVEIQGDRVLTEKWRIDRVFYYLAFTSIVCLTAVLISPSPEVRMVAAGMWVGAAALAKYLLSRAYRGQ